MSLDYYARDFARTAVKIADTLEKVAIEYKRSNDLKEKQFTLASSQLTAEQDYKPVAP